MTAVPYADNHGTRIYYEVEGEGPPLVLLHGLGLDLQWWRQMGYSPALKNDHQLILIDARAHGASDKPHDPEAYRMASRVADVVAVLDDLNLSRAHYFGYSMGGWIGWGMAKYAPERLCSLVVGGWDPYEPKEFDFLLALYRSGMGALLEALELMYGPRCTPWLRARALANDRQALIALLSLEERAGFEDMLPNITIPCLVFAGEATDEHPGSKRCVGGLPNATFASLPGLNHIEAIYRIDLVLPHIHRFLAAVGEEGRTTP
jgi:pimeloyl-ACP methyl ester carboxylesterase